MHEDLFHAIEFGAFSNTFGRTGNVDTTAVAACLDPCPYCGNDHINVSVSSRNTEYEHIQLKLHCDNCPAIHSGKVSSEDKEVPRRGVECADSVKIRKMIINWNTRTTPKASFVDTAERFLFAATGRDYLIEIIKKSSC